MKSTSTALEGVRILEPSIFSDERGYFCETYNQSTLKALGIAAHFVQDNESLSHHGVVRGLHFQKPPFAQAKLIRVLEGEILDVVLDIRLSSPTFGRSTSVVLSSDNHLQLFVPKGFAHGFSVLSAQARIAYKCDAFYTPQSEGVFDAFDGDLSIDWKIDPPLILRSEKDRCAALSFAAYRDKPAFV